MDRSGDDRSGDDRAVDDRAGDDRPGPAPSAFRRRAGSALVVLGLVAILTGVFHVLNAVGAAEDRRFENRRSYNQVKEAVHGSFPLGLAIGLGGLGLAMLGARVRR